MPVRALLALKEDDVLVFDYPVGRPLDLTVNKKLKYQGEIVTAGRKRAFQALKLVVKP
jgi:flagellar motor switch/type III secretory pathway protein FliN